MQMAIASIARTGASSLASLLARATSVFATAAGAATLMPGNGVAEFAVSCDVVVSKLRFMMAPMWKTSSPCSANADLRYLRTPKQGQLRHRNRKCVNKLT